MALALAAACESDGDEAAEALTPPESGTVVATLTAPAMASPEGPFEVDVEVPNYGPAAVQLVVRGTTHEVDLVADGQRLVGQLSLDGPFDLGDHIIALRGTVADLEVGGHAMVHVSNSPACPAGQTRIVGECATIQSGHAITLDRIMPWYEMGLDARGQVESYRSMAHPQTQHLVGDVFVGCNSDAVSLTALEDFFGTEEFGRWKQRPISSETRIKEAAGLAVCQYLRLDTTHSLAFTSSRGDGDGPGGIAVWRLPPLDERPLQKATLLTSLADPAGFEDIVYADGRLYAAHKPNRIAIFDVNTATGTLTKLSDVAFPSLATVWGLALDGQTLYVTDAGIQHPHEDGTTHFHTGGTLAVIDVSEAHNPVLVSRLDTLGPSRGIAVLPDSVLAVASGPAGVELVDIVDPAWPVRIASAPTHATTMSLAYEGGYLLVSHWNYVALYDVSERGTLRLLDSSDGLEAPLIGLTPPWDRALGQMFQSVTQVNLTNGLAIVSEFDSLRIGPIDGGRVGPRLITHQRRMGITPGDVTSHEAITFHNGGRTALWAEVQASELVSSDGTRVTLGPGETGILEFAVRGLDQYTNMALSTNDTANPTRAIQLLPNDQRLQIGEEMSHFQLPVISGCEDDDRCPAEGTCLRLAPDTLDSRPVVLAFFSSW